MDQTLKKVQAFLTGALSVSDLIIDPTLPQILTDLHDQVSQTEIETSFLIGSDWRLALDTYPLAILITGPDLCIQYVNPAFEQMTGYPFHTISGKKPNVLKSGLMPPETYQDLWQALNKGESWHGEFLNRRYNKSLYWEWSSISPIKDKYNSIKNYISIKQDITDRKQNEMALQYQVTVLESLADAVISTDLEMNILSWNPAAKKMYGWSFADVLGVSWLSLQPNCIFEETTRDEVMQIVMSSGSWSGRVQQQNADGQKIIAFVVCSLVHNAQNEPTGLVIINRDLTSHEALHQAWQESELRFQQVAENLDEVLWSYDLLKSELAYMSPSIEKLAGISAEALHEDESLWPSLVHPEDLDNYLAWRRTLLSRDSAQTHTAYQYRILRPDGQFRWVKTKAKTSFNSQQQAEKLWGLTEDITLNKQIEAALIDSERFAYAVLNALDANICVIDCTGTIIAANEAWSDFSGMNQGNESFEGWNYLQVCEQTQGKDSEEAQAVAQGIRKVLSGELAVFSMEYPCHSPHEKRWFIVKASPMSGDSQNRVVISHQNITQQKKDQMALRHLNDHLEELVEQRTQALNQSLNKLQNANQDLIRANQLKDSFLANMSHELRTPLTGILGMSDLLLQELLGPLNPKQSKSLGTIQASGQHLLSLINDILDLSKVEAGMLELFPEWLDAETAAREALAIVKQMARQKEISLALKVEPFDLQIFADARQLKQIFVNLLSNSIKFTPSKGLVSLDICIQDEWIKISIYDTGIGISPENLARLFRPFVQIDSGLARQQTGTGLGLSLVKRLAEAHGGSIQVSSTEGKGSCFTLLFPRQNTFLSRQGLHPVSSTNPLPEKSHQKKILFVDDNPIEIEVIQSFIEHMDHQIHSFTDGHQALLWLENNLPDLILMDIQMPEIDGFELVQRIRQSRLQSVADLPVIALTYLDTEEIQQHILQQGFDAYLGKPITVSKLQKLIETTLLRVKKIVP